MRDGNVALSVARAGQIVYTFDDDDMMTDGELLEGRTPTKQRNGMS